MRGKAQKFNDLVRNGIDGNAQVRIEVNSQAEALELYRAVLLGRGLPPFRNTTEMKPNEAEAFLLPNDMNVHWYTTFDPRTGLLVGHPAKDPFYVVPHLQVHLPRDKNGRIYITWPKK